ncbi:hypothetical protein MLAC_24440 [Mycobacterium lacus]|uniref:Transposase n=1 Tax=Mycobacterium lacus TaxID=169765 RepID=A0A7I7NKX1_9MYCO|nr:hypothetical protein [Mycobacterium lacus]BBX97150.1 hypothetical protein MLAC_24440 [Mycobacterium lacus]
MDRGTLSGAAEIGKALGKVSGKYKVDKHFVTTITDTSFTFARNQAAIDAEAALDGIYVLRTSVDPDTLDAAGVVAGYKNLANIERDFRIIKADDLDLRPIYHRLDQRVRARADLPAGLLPRLAPTQGLGAADLHRRNTTGARQPGRARATLRRRQRESLDKTRRRRQPLRSFRGLLDHLGTLTRDRIRYHDTDIEIDKLTEPTPDQRRAFDLIDTTIPLTIAA